MHVTYSCQSTMVAVALVIALFSAAAICIIFCSVGLFPHLCIELLCHQNVLRTDVSLFIDMEPTTVV